MDEQVAFMVETAQRLERAGIPYMVTGSVALSFYATPRMTRDVDFVVEVEPPQAEGLIEVFRQDCYVSAEAVREAVANRGMFNVIHDEWMTKADFVVRKDDPYRETEFGRRRPAEIAGATVMVVAPEDLVLSKLCWAKLSPSEQQERDVSSLLSARALDRAYLSLWAARLGVEEALDRLWPEAT